jgi:glycosyltransferase involved in cell wall biosynthesis
MRKINVMFMQSQAYFGSDSMIHSLIMRYLDRSRINVHVACNQGTPNNKSASLKALETIPNLHIRPTNFGPTVNDRSKQVIVKDTLVGVAPALISLGGLVKYVKTNRIDIIHGTEKPRDAFYGLILARLTGARCITHLHVKVENWISPLVRWSMKHDDALIAVSDFVARSSVTMGYSADKTYYVLNSLDSNKWNDAIDGSAVRQEFGIAPHIPVLSIISRLFPWKGHTELLKALAQVKMSHPNFKLLIVGEDDPRATPGGGSYMAELKALTSELNLQQQVIFTGFRRDIPQLLAASDIFTMPTFEEPCAVAFLEAMAMRKPIIALQSGGTPQLVDQGKAGFLSPPQDITQLAANILTLMNDPELRTQMGTYARTRVEQFFNPARMANEIEQVYRHVLCMLDIAPGATQIAETMLHRAK